MVKRRRYAGCDQIGKGISLGGLESSRQRIIGAKKNPWIMFLKQWAYDQGISYGDALRDPRASKEYRKQMGGGVVLGGQKTKRRKKSTSMREYY